jgi:hypothetical protein
MAVVSPAAAAQKVYVPERSWTDDWEFPVTIADWGWECSGDLWFGGSASSDLWLWYPNSVDTTNPDEYMPDGRAWPWIRGLEKTKGTYYFSTGEGRTGKVISGWFKTRTRLHRHHLGDPYPEFDATPPAGVDLETFRATTTGVFDHLRHPRVGWIWRMVGIEKALLTVTVQHRESEGPDDVDWQLISYQGTESYKDHKICKVFGMEYIEP